ncbi:N-acetyltransferase DgcN [Qipengyuania sp. ASV99]|uniref:N-acetyltransferase DgcN n=1 Tax=Qipengyuania sp. ASV99 TaxID=3399681 RepID=UPI003A4C5F80
MISGPYLLYLGEAADPISVKTARGIAQWRPDACIGQRRLPGCEIDLGLADLTYAEAAAAGAKIMVIGDANAGGVLRTSAHPEIIAALEAGLDVASGLHQRLKDVAAIQDTAQRLGRTLHDVRDAPEGLKVGTGKPRAGLRLLTVGTDCSVGKMYTSLALEQEMRARSIPADFKATGQTGVLISGNGIAIDAVVADFISGAVEQLAPARNVPGWDIIEGQGSLFHPSYAGVSLGLLHGAQPHALVLCHEAGRPHIRGLEGRPLPGFAECIDANLAAARLTNPTVRAIGVSVNTSRLDPRERRAFCENLSDTLGLPCQDPLIDGVGQIVDNLIACFEPS